MIPPSRPVPTTGTTVLPNDAAPRAGGVSAESTSPSSGNASPGYGTEAVWLASFDPQSGQWQPVTSHLDPAARTVTAQVPHLSWWAPWTWDWRGIDARLQQALSALGIATR